MRSSCGPAAMAYVLQEDRGWIVMFLRWVRYDAADAGRSWLTQEDRGCAGRSRAGGVERDAGEQETAATQEVGEVVRVLVARVPVLDPRRVVQSRIAPLQVR